MKTPRKKTPPLLVESLPLFLAATAYAAAWNGWDNSASYSGLSGASVVQHSGAVIVGSACGADEEVAMWNGSAPFTWINWAGLAGNAPNWSNGTTTSKLSNPTASHGSNTEMQAGVGVTFTYMGDPMYVDLWVGAEWF